MNVAPRRYVKPLAPAVVAGRDELDALSQIKSFDVRSVVQHSCGCGCGRVSSPSTVLVHGTVLVQYGPVVIDEGETQCM